MLPLPAAAFSMDILLAQFLTGLAYASTLFLVAAGLTIIFGVTRVVNFAHGSLYMLGAYLAYTITAALPSTPPAFFGGLLLVIKTADCLPVLIADPERRVVAAAHCGWRGTQKRILDRVVDVARGCRLVGISLMTAPPPAHKIVGLTYGSLTVEDRREIRNSWNWVDIAMTCIVLGFVAAIYTYFSFWI